MPGTLAAMAKWKTTTEKGKRGRKKARKPRVNNSCLAQEEKTGEAGEREREDWLALALGLGGPDVTHGTLDKALGRLQQDTKGWYNEGHHPGNQAMGNHRADLVASLLIIFCYLLVVLIHLDDVDMVILMVKSLMSLLRVSYWKYYLVCQVNVKNKDCN